MIGRPVSVSGDLLPIRDRSGLFLYGLFDWQEYRVDEANTYSIFRWLTEVDMDTKQTGDIVEQAAILKALKFGWGVLCPIGDRLPYDLVFDVDGTLIKVQVKSAWFDARKGNYVVDNRRTKTNRRRMVRDAYSQEDFDFAIVYLADLDLFYVLPVAAFIAYGSEIHLVEADKRQRRPTSHMYRDAWNLITSYSNARVNESIRKPDLDPEICRDEDSSIMSVIPSIDSIVSR